MGKRNADYESSQKEQSQDLFDVMSEHEGKSVVLAESTDVGNSHFLSVLDEELVRIPTVMNPELKKKEKEEREGKEEDAEVPEEQLEEDADGEDEDETAVAEEEE